MGRKHYIYTDTQLDEVTASDRALIIVALNYFKKSTYDSWDNCKGVQRIDNLVEILKRS